jgi:hypothetical protein
MMLGVVAGGVISGQALSRLGGHYRLQGLTGLAIMAAGVFLLARMTANTSYGQAIANIVLMGVGLGVTFPVYTLVVQNTVPYRVLGVATSSIQFFRSLGGTLGLAVLGSVMTNRFAAELAKVVPARVKEVVPREQLAYLAENPQALLSPEARFQLEAAFTPLGAEGAGLLEQLLDALRQALSSAIGEVFLISLVVVAVAWAATLLLRPAPAEQKTAGPEQGETVVWQAGPPRRG